MAQTILRRWAIAVVAAGAFGVTSASATPIIGSIMFSDGFTSLSATNTAVVSNLININVGSSTLALLLLGGPAVGASGPVVALGGIATIVAALVVRGVAGARRAHR